VGEDDKEDKYRVRRFMETERKDIKKE